MSSLFDGKPGEKVLKIFEEIAAIPRPSYQESAISKFVFDRGAAAKNEVIIDSDNNVIIYVDATEGYENEPTIVLQAHTDMVCEKTSGCTKDMEKEGIDLVLDGDILSAKGTTLGGDDGIGVAMMLAIMEDESLPHPKLQLVFTSSEEVGMDGAKAFDKSKLYGSRILINLDSEKEGELLAGCAGGGRVNMNLPLKRESLPGGYELRTVRIGGLRGGHSGDEINKGRANATRLMASLLAKLSEKIDIRLVSLTGGSKDNAIPRESIALVALPTESISTATDMILKTGESVRAEYHGADPDIRYEITESQSIAETSDINPNQSLTRESTETVLRLILSLPNGVIRMSDDIDGLVETSLNLGVTVMKRDTLHLGTSVRSSVGSAYEALRDQLLYVAKGYGADTEVTGEYPAWEYNTNSKLIEKACTLYKEMYGKDMEVRAIHAGLECGLFISDMEKELRGTADTTVEAISIGPDLFDVHTPDERLSISSVARVYEYLTKLIGEQKNI